MRHRAGVMALMACVVLASPLAAAPERASAGPRASSRAAVVAPRKAEPRARTCTAARCDAIGAYEAWNRAAADAPATPISDETAPNLTALSFTPSTVEVGDLGDELVNGMLEATDDLSGLDGEVVHGSVTLRYPDLSVLQQTNLLAPTAGDPLDATFEFTFVLPIGLEPGDYPVGVVLTDNVGNTRTLAAADLEALSLPSEITVTRPDAPPAPFVAAPENGTVFCGDPVPVVLAGMTTPGYTVRFRENLATVGEVIADGSGAFALIQPFGIGQHRVNAFAFDGSGVAAVLSPPTLRRFTVRAVPEPLLPPETRHARISPRNQDGVRDTTRVSVRAKEAGEVRFRIMDGATVVRLSRWLPVARNADATWTWDGRTQRLRFAVSGTYRVVADWRSSACEIEQAGARVVVDNRAPTVVQAQPWLDRFYPREDDALTEYRDRMPFGFRGLDEPAYVALEISRRGGDVVARTRLGLRRAGPGRATWNGRTRSGELFPEGDYVAVWRFTDRVGNQSRSERLPFALSWQHVVERRDRIQVFADQSVSSVEQGCGDVVAGGSSYSRGVRVRTTNCNDDADTADLALLRYTFRLRRAPVYGTAAVAVDGTVDTPDEYGLFGMVYREPNVFRFLGKGLTNHRRRWSTLAPFNLQRYAVRDRATIGLFTLSPCDCANTSYDYATLALDYTYGALE